MMNDSESDGKVSHSDLARLYYDTICRPQDRRVAVSNGCDMNKWDAENPPYDANKVPKLSLGDKFFYWTIDSKHSSLAFAIPAFFFLLLAVLSACG